MMCMLLDMVSLKITENIIIKVLLAILGSWRWGPYMEDLTYKEIAYVDPCQIYGAEKWWEKKQ